MEEDDDILAAMDARIDAHRMILGVLIRHLPDRHGALADLYALEKVARQQNLNSATIEEIVELRDALDDL